ncbi:MAG: site-specific DNA-methyltransferase [Patescibacteria group bacterium]|nr:site-specific DNA-methyltransferase [Patescibacteria group bacterium]
MDNQVITSEYALYNDDCVRFMPTLPDNSIDISVYSPPFYDLYSYSSSDEDMANCRNYKEFLENYEFLVKEMGRVIKPGRCTVVHCMPVPKGQHLIDFPGDIIRLHEKHGFVYHDEHYIWKEPLRVAIKTRALGLMHRQIVKDSTMCRAAFADKILVFRKKGKNEIPVTHADGFITYAGTTPIPPDLVEKYKGWKNPKTNKLSHWIWQHYASSVWMDINLGRVLKYKEARDAEDEKHVCPLQLDVVERCISMWSNPGETLLTPFLGVGTEVYCAVLNGRKGIGIELKPSYFRQAVKNVAMAEHDRLAGGNATLFDVEPEETIDEEDLEPIEEMA